MTIDIAGKDYLNTTWEVLNNSDSSTNSTNVLGIVSLKKDTSDEDVALNSKQHSNTTKL